MRKFGKALGVAVVAGAAVFTMSSASAFWGGGPWGYPGYGGWGGYPGYGGWGGYPGYGGWGGILAMEATAATAATRVTAATPPGWRSTHSLRVPAHRVAKPSNSVC